MSPECPKKFIIRTSDRGTFKKCRQLWDFTSKLRMNYEYTPGIEALDFGIAYHAGMEEYYDPTMWGTERAEQACLAVFREHIRDWGRRLQMAGQIEAQRERLNELHVMGVGMMQHYFKWAKEADKYLEPILVEQEFEVPIPVRSWPVVQLPAGFEAFAVDGYTGNYLHKYCSDCGDWHPVVYQGRIDLIVKDKSTGLLWILDHKTAAQFGESVAHLDLDQQCGSYYWACRRMLGIDVHGVIYSEHRKKVPVDMPQILKNGNLSKNKQQDVTYESYLEAIHKLGQDPEDYADFLEHLKSKPKQEYFRRNTIARTDGELAILERHILDEAIDILSDPKIYPTPSQWNCRGCAFQTPCLMREDGSSWEMYLRDSPLYVNRSTVVEGDQG